MSDVTPERPYADPNHSGNGPEHLTGATCITFDCEEPAGTWWSPLWCQRCNTDRMDRIGRRLREMLEYAEGAIGPFATPEPPE